MEQITQTEKSILNLLEVDKVFIADSVQHIISRINEGELNPLDVKLKFKVFEEIIKQASGTIDRMARAEAETYGTPQFEKMGAIISLIEAGVSYDYAHCGDTVYNELEKQEEELKAKKDKRKKFLQSIDGQITVADELTGEIITILQPIKKSTSTIKIGFK